MAITQNTYTGNGSTVLFSFTFPYLETTDIKVSLNGVNTTAYTLANATTIQFNSAPADGTAIRIYRQTDDSGLTATFSPGSAIRSQDLNDNFTQVIYSSQESTRDSTLAVDTANSALTSAVSAVSSASEAVSTANTANSNAVTAVSTATAASSTAASALSTANAADSKATSALSNSATALTTATSASSSAASAVSTATAASASAAAAVSTATAAASDASSAVATATNAAADASAALIAANSAVLEAADATAFGVAANSNALEAVAIANAASSAIGSAVLYSTVNDSTAIPDPAVDGEAVEVVDSTGIESFTPLTNIPAGFVGDLGLSVRLIYNETEATWVWIQYFPNDPESRYLALSGGSLTDQLFAYSTGGLPAPGIAFVGDSNTGVANLGADELALVTGGSARLTVDASGTVDVPGSLTSSGTSVVLDTDPRLSDSRIPSDGSVTTAKLASGAVTADKIASATIVDSNISGTAAISSSKLSDSGVVAGTYGSSTQIPTISVNAKGIVTAASTSEIGGNLVSTTDVGTVTGTMLAADTITDDNISSTASISGSKIQAASTTSPGVVQLFDGTNSTSTSFAATASSVKTTYDLALGAVIPTGTVMLFVQTNAPTGWTKSTTHNNKALRVVSGTASSGGTTAFTSVFASRTPGGSIANTTAGGSISNTTAGGSVSGSNSGGSVGATTLTAAQMPTHAHQAGNGAGSNTVFFNTYTFSSENTYVSTFDSSTTSMNRGTSNTGGSTSHTHGLTVPSWSGSFTGTAHGHTFTGSAHNHTFTGTAMDFAVQYVDVILAVKN